MRKIMIGLILAIWTSLALGEDAAVTISAADAPVVALSLPAQVKVYSNPPKTTIVASNMFLSVWSVPSVKTAQEALPLVAETVKGDVLQFQATQTNAINVAGVPAVHLIGTGVEADDGDPSTADVVVFAVGAQAFVACVHGEHNDASRERQPMLDALLTAKSR
jgi:hypothetical protein